MKLIGYFFFLFLTVSPHSNFFCESTTFIPLMSVFLLVKQNPWYRPRESSPLTLKCTWTYHQRERPQLHPHAHAHAHANTPARARTGRQIERADMTFVICSLSQHSWVKLRLLRMQACRGSIFVILTTEEKNNSSTWPASVYITGNVMLQLREQSESKTEVWAAGWKEV